jgi:hypothetical protein
MEENLSQKEIALPNATAILVLGIISIVGCCCYGIVGIVCGIIALVMGNSSMKLYQEDSGRYSLSSYQNVKIGRICAIIGLIFSLTYIIWYIWLLVNVGMDALTDPELMQQRIMEMFS